jgi:hypothetical protein
MALNLGHLKGNHVHWLLFIVAFSSSAAMGANQLEKSYGTAEPRERLVASLPANTLDYWSDVKPVIDQRCVVCHGCYDAPCQLKMSSIEGIVRGASKQKVYDTSRLQMGDLTRLFEDAQTVTEWRNKGFHPIVNEYKDSPKANRNASVMYQMLKLKQENPLPKGKKLPAKSFDLSLNRKQVCTQADEFDKYASKHPLGGMPYALPGLASEEQKTLMTWVEQGAVYTARAPLPSGFAEQISNWEKFLNGSSLKQQLTARYLYEHLSYAHLYFPAVDEQHFFTMVRSSTPPGQAIKIISTRLPYSAPGVERVYYRIQRYVATIVEKTHMPYRLDTQRMQRWQSLFIDADYKVTALPTYDLGHASNPFQTFAELPVMARHKFLLDEAQFTIMAYIKGPVCRGGVALDVIEDDFWVFFTDPDRPHEQKLEAFLATNAKQLELPASGEVHQPMQKWHQYQKLQAAFLASKNQYLAEQYKGAEKLSLTIDGVWDGKGVNNNAALTVYRHYDNATVEKGMLGQAPKTAWLVDYTLLERITYLLVAGYDVYGKLGHQLDTRLYMDFLRMEGESNFLLMLPVAARTKERNFWYRGAKQKTLAYVSSPVFENNSQPDIDYKTDNPKLELYDMLRQRLKAVLPTEHEMASVSNRDIQQQLGRLNKLVGKPATTMPENAMLQVNTSTGPEYFTLLRNSAHSSMSSMFKEDKRRLPSEDTLTVLPGFIGAYPNIFFVVDEQKVSSFVDALSGLETEADYAAVLDSYGIRRTNRDFWSHSDAFHAGYKKLSPLRYGVLDYGRFENR